MNEADYSVNAGRYMESIGEDGREMLGRMNLNDLGTFHLFDAHESIQRVCEAGQLSIADSWEVLYRTWLRCKHLPG